MRGFHTNIDRETKANSSYRKVLYTGKHTQLVLMSLKPGEEIGLETHLDNDQFFRFESGQGKCLVDGNEYTVSDGDVLIVPAGAEHNIINASATADLKLYTLYSPPHHKDGLVRETKAKADQNSADFDGQISET